MHVRSVCGSGFRKKMAAAFPQFWALRANVVMILFAMDSGWPIRGRAPRV
jgi:hypothetical protein